MVNLADCVENSRTAEVSRKADVFIGGIGIFDM